MHPLSRELLDWYAEHGRDLPWRRQVDPYRNWVAEVMLQQTRVEAVLPYYRAFLERFPTVQDLAAAPLQDVLALWSGLGYYSRARNLHRGARQLAERLASGRGFPSSAAEWREVAGVGPYTAAAVASIAQGADEVAVDGNVQRVLCRLHAFPGDPRRPAGRRWVESAARELLPPGRAGDFNQALMDLGAAVCTPRSPRCRACPWRDACAARREGLQDVLPVRARGTRPRPVRAVSGAWLRGNHLLLARRPERGLLGGLWELPGGRLAEGEEPGPGLERLLAERLGLRLRAGEELGELRHVFTHLDWRARLLAVQGEGEPRPLHYDELRWLPLSSLEAALDAGPAAAAAEGPGALPPLSRLAEKALALLLRRRVQLGLFD